MNFTVYNNGDKILYLHKSVMHRNVLTDENVASSTFAVVGLIWSLVTEFSYTAMSTKSAYIRTMWQCLHQGPSLGVNKVYNLFIY